MNDLQNSIGNVSNTLQQAKEYADRNYFEWKILHTWTDKEGEDKNPYARWFTACKSPMTYDNWEYGDVYIKDILDTNPVLLSATDEWKETYND